MLASTLDHARDLLLMINQFREQLPRPIVGIGHSMGAVQLYFPSPISNILSRTAYLILFQNCPVYAASPAPPVPGSH
jgi:hypothetical protein